jgi:hypothetical protein
MTDVELDNVRREAFSRGFEAMRNLATAEVRQYKVFVEDTFGHVHSVPRAVRQLEKVLLAIPTPKDVTVEDIKGLVDRLLGLPAEVTENVPPSIPEGGTILSVR